MSDDLAEWLRGVLAAERSRVERLRHWDPTEDGGYLACPATRSEPLGDLAYGEDACDCDLADRKAELLASVEADEQLLNICTRWLAFGVGDSDYDRAGEGALQDAAPLVLSHVASRYRHRLGYHQEWAPLAQAR